MNTQINLRMSEKLLETAKSYSEEHGYGSIQDFIKETIREKLFDEPQISNEELELVKKMAVVSEKKTFMEQKRNCSLNLGEESNGI